MHFVTMTNSSLTISIKYFFKKWKKYLEGFDFQISHVSIHIYFHSWTEHDYYPYYCFNGNIQSSQERRLCKVSFFIIGVLLQKVEKCWDYFCKEKEKNTQRQKKLLLRLNLRFFFFSLSRFHQFIGIFFYSYNDFYKEEKKR